MGKIGRLKWSNLEDQLRNVVYDNLLVEGTMVGRDLAVTNVRTGARKSADLNTTTEVAANVADEFILNNRLYAYSAMDGATNLVSTVLTDWTDAGAAVSSQVSVGLYRITLTAGAGSVLYAFASAANNRNLMCQARLVSGTVPATSIATFRGASTPLGTPFDLTTLTSSFQDVNPTVTSASTSDDVIFSLASGTCVIELQYIRAVDSLISHAAFPDGSVAGAAYGADKLACSPSWNSTGTILSYAAMYDSSGFPVDNGRIFQAGASANGNPVNYCNVFVPASNAFLDCGGAAVGQATNIWDDSNVHFSSIDWDGVDNGIRYDLLGRTAYTQSAIATDELDIGCNGNAAGDEFHGIVGLLVFDRVLPDIEFAALVSGITADFVKFGGRR